MNMLEDEEEVWCFLLEEAERQGEFGMNQFILQKQEEATNAYHRVPQSEAPQWLQTVMLAEIAQQLERQNEHLERIAGHLEKVYISSKVYKIMYHCSKCGAINSPDSQYCKKCGAHFQ